MKIPLFIYYKCKTKNVEWVKVKYEGKISWLALKLCTFLSSIVVTLTPTLSIFKQQNNNIFAKKTIIIVLVYLPNLPIFKLVDSENENMLF